MVSTYESEPLLETARDPSAAARELHVATDPAKGGNSGLKREARLVPALVVLPAVQDLVNSLDGVQQTLEYIGSSGFRMGYRLQLGLGSSQ